MRGKLALGTASAIAAVLLAAGPRTAPAPSPSPQPTAAQVDAAISHAAASAGLTSA